MLYGAVKSGNPTRYFNGTRCGATYESPVITVPIDPKPPISEYSLEETNSSGCVDKRVLVSTVTEEHSYLYAGSRLLRETITTTAEDGTVTTEVLDFAYDAQGAPYALTYTASSGTAQTYYYITNLQGDVMKLIDGTGREVARYHYDPYGKPQYVSGAMADVNPLQYRGYYHDADTGFYYLQSRYYDPAICRFINADAYTVSSSEFSGQNMFAYCGNNPASRTDANGEAWWAWVAAVAVVAVCAVAVVATAGGAAAAITAVTAVANGAAATTCASTVAAGAFIGSSTAFAGAAYMAACDSQSWDEFAAHGEGALVGTILGGAVGMLAANALNAGNCFIAGTLIATQDGNIPIEEIKVGDYVWAWDEATKDTALKQVVETYVSEAEELIHLTVNGEKITCTPGHPFYSPVKGWTDAVHLRAGDVLVLLNGEYVVVEWVQHELLEDPVRVYNFQVEGFHTYYVSNHSILVHNKCKETYNSGNSTGTSQAPKQGEPNSTYTQISSDGQGTVVSQTTYNEYSMPGIRVDYMGRGHGNVPVPHMHTFAYAIVDGVVRRCGEVISPI